jgi:hypothetical protein
VFCVLRSEGVESTVSTCVFSTISTCAALPKLGCSQCSHQR